MLPMGLASLLAAWHRWLCWPHEGMCCPCECDKYQW